ncbi:hypothetical protein KRR26_36250 [Corallococcus sp. M34]|uniref:hypothetical protein n=1 Tax=Citreicoccus inhibens TaxID=2849499 RepID=UPI001C243F29|nr:hypothetical protein [Citreicoccus inhibens]MBU8901049.1 hypothetical protein [Citreicoccus inhibens]
MSWSIQFPEVSTLRQSLGSAAHAQNLAIATLDGDKELPIPGGKLSLSAALRTPIELFNDRNDADDQGIIGVPAKDSDGSTPEPLYSTDNAACWLKYAVEVSAKAEGTGEFPFVTLNGGGSVNVVVADYRSHSPAQNLEDALRQDVQSLRLPFLLSDVQQLQAGDALSFQTRLAVKAGLKVSWSFVGATLASVIAKRLTKLVALQLDADVAAFIGASVAIEDEFRLVFSRPMNGGPLRVSVRKATARTGTTGAGITVSLGGDSPVLTALLKAVATSKEAQDVAEVVNGIRNNSVRPALEPLAIALFDRLGIPVTVDQLFSAYDTLRKLVEGSVNTALTGNFSYEYRRCTEDATILELELSAQELETAHKSLLSGNLEAIQKTVPDSALRRFFQMQSITREQTWGFGLQWRDLVIGKNEGRQSLKSVVQNASRDLRNGPRRIAYLGARSFEQSGVVYGNEDRRYGIDFSAQMPEYSLTPSADEFEYAFYARASLEAKLSKGYLHRITSDAVVWGIIQQDAAPALIEKLHAIAPQGTNTTARLELRIDQEYFRRFISMLDSEADRERHQFALALARAMPEDPKLVVRSTPGNRELVFAPIWDEYLKAKGRDWNNDRIIRTVVARLKTLGAMGGPDLIEWEKSGRPGTLIDLFVQESRYGGDIGGKPFGKIHAYWRDVVDRLSFLSRAIRSETAISEHDTHSVIVNAFEALNDQVAESFRMRAFVSWLSAMANLWSLGAGVQRTLSIYAEDQPEIVISNG